MVAVWFVKRVNLVSNFLISERRRCGFDFLPLRLGGAPLWLELASVSRELCKHDKHIRELSR